MSLRISIPAAALSALLSAACLPERGAPPKAQPVAAQQKSGKTATPPAAPPRAPAPPGSSACEQAALRLAPGAVVARIDGKDITVDELGEQLASAESRALRTYCGEVAKAREAVLDNLVQQRVLTAAAEQAGKPLNEYVQGRVEAQVPEPGDAEIEAFYNARKSPETPALELVRDQVVQAMKAESSDKVFSAILAELKASAKVETMLPDVRPPALELLAAHSPTLGANEGVQLVEFSDFECPYCSKAADTVRELKTKYAGEKVQFVYRHFPLSFHPNAMPAAEFSQCAHEQDKFWPLHDAIFAGQRELSKDKLREMATQVGLDMARLDDCLNTGRGRKLVDEDMAKAGEAGVGGTPSFYINGRSFDGNPTAQGLSEAIDAELARLKG